MPKQAISLLKTWFQTGDKPTQSQFWDWLDSFWHKDDAIPTSSVSGLDGILNNLATETYVDAAIATAIGSGAIEPVTQTVAVNGSVLLSGSLLTRVVVLPDTVDRTIYIGTTVGGQEYCDFGLVLANEPLVFAQDKWFGPGGVLHFSGFSSPIQVKIYYQ